MIEHETILVLRGQFSKWSICPNTDYELTGYSLRILTHGDLKRCEKAGLNLRIFPSGNAIMSVRPMIPTVDGYTTIVDKKLERKFVGKIFDNITLQIYRTELDGYWFTHVYFNPLEL